MLAERQTNIDQGKAVRLKVNRAIVGAFAAALALCVIILFVIMTGGELVSLLDVIPYVFLVFPFITLAKPNYLGYLLALFLPLQQILFCIVYTQNPEWGYAMKWILGWKDCCLIITLALALLRFKRALLPKKSWEYCIAVYTVFMLLMLLQRKFPLMSMVASLRFNLASFFFLLGGFYAAMSIRQIHFLLRIFFWVVLAVIVFGIFEVSFLSEAFFLNYIDIGGFKSGVHETAVTQHIGSYLYAPGFLMKRRMVSLLLGSTSTGHFLVFALCLLLACRKTGIGIKSDALHSGFIVLMAFGIFLTTSRLAMAEALAVGCYYTVTGRLSTKLRYGILGLLGICCMFVLYGNAVASVLSSTFSASDASTFKHIRSILDIPFSYLGMGLGVAANVFANIDTYTAREGVYNKMLIEIGMVGFGLFAMTYFLVIRNSLRFRKISGNDDGARLAKAICSMGAMYAIVMIPSLFITVTLFSVVSHGFFWYMLGIGFRLQRTALSGAAPKTAGYAR